MPVLKCKKEAPVVPAKKFGDHGAVLHSADADRVRPHAHRLPPPLAHDRSRRVRGPGRHDPAASGGASGLWTLSPDAFLGANDTAHPWTDGKLYESFASSTQKDCGNPSSPLTDWHVWNCYSAASDWAAYLDGALQHSTATNTVQSNALGIGLGSTPSSGHYADLYVAEICIFADKLSTTHRDAMYNYMVNG